MPSSTTPPTRTASGSDGGTSAELPSSDSPMLKNGPTVWDAVGRSATSVLHRGRLAPAQHYVEAVGERPFGHGLLEVELRDQALAVPPVGHRVEDRVLEEERVAREVHLRDEPRRESRAEQRDVDVRRSPCVGMVLPRIRSRLDRDEAVASVVVGDAAAGAAEVGVDGRGVAVALVPVAPRRVRLPDLDEAVPDRPPVAVEHAAAQDHSLAERLARVLPGEVVVELADALVAVDGPGHLREGMAQRNQWTLRRAKARPHVGGM